MCNEKNGCCSSNNQNDEVNECSEDAKKKCGCLSNPDKDCEKKDK